MSSGDERPQYLEKLPEFIEILFALIVAAGFILIASHFQLTSSPHFTCAQDIWVLPALTVAYFFIISDWLFYRKLIDERNNPYQRNPIRFLIDTFLIFPLMFLLIHFAFLVWDKDMFHFYVFTLTAWHLSTMVWHLAVWWDSNKTWNEVKDSVCWHLMCGIIYLALGLLYLLFISPIWMTEARDIVSVVGRILIFVLVPIFNGIRIYQFASKE